MTPFVSPFEGFCRLDGAGRSSVWKDEEPFPLRVDVAVGAADDSNGHVERRLRKVRVRRCERWAVAGLLVLCAAGTAPAAAAEVPGRIVDRMVAVYADLDSYRDTGEVVTVFHTDTGKWTDVVRFTTLFSRDGSGPAFPTFPRGTTDDGAREPLFRFEFRHKAGRAGPWHDYVVWADGTAIRSWWDIHGRVERHGRISEAIATPMGVSGMSSGNVPGLLFGTLSPLLNLTDISDEGVETVDGEPCHKLRATPYGSGESWTLWIDRRTYLLRRVQIVRRPDDAEVVATTTYFPETDVRIDPEAFGFEPPD